MGFRRDEGKNTEHRTLNNGSLTSMGRPWDFSEMESHSSTDTRPAVRWLIAQAKPVRSWILLSIGIAFFGGLLIVFQARLMADIIHGACMDRLSREELRPMFFVLAIVVTIRALLLWVKEISGFQAGALVRENLRLSILKHLAETGPIGIGGRPAGGLATVATEQVEAVHGFFSDYLPQLVIAVLIPLTLAAFVFPISWAAAGLLLVTAPMIPLFMVLIGMGAESISQRNFQALARLSAHFLDILQGLATLKLFSRSRTETESIQEVSEQYRLQTMKVLRVAFLSAAVLEFFSSFAIAMTAIYLGMSFLGYISFGTYGTPLAFADGLFILILAPDFYLPLRDLGSHFHVRAEAVGAAGEIRKVLELPVINQDGISPSWKKGHPLNIRFENVHYGFDGGRRAAICGIDLEIDFGKRLAIVGASGAGKTTIGRLLLAFDQPSSGKIYINGVDLSTLDSESWQKHVSWIGQHPVLFHGTIRENIRIGNPDASDEEVEAASIAASVNIFTDRLPLGLDTSIGEHGSGLSRGQAQQVALARAFLKNSSLLLLDEPTAGLDSDTELHIMDALFRFCKHRTLIFMTHRLGRIHEADRIVVLADGNVAEQGTFEELVHTRGLLSQFLTSGHEEVFFWEGP
jgi:ATP-binding cassette, subfamily C, bacterial CydD